MPKLSEFQQSNDLLRQAFKDYWRGYREHTENPNWPNNGEYPPVPDALHGLTCGAKTRAGTPCKRVDLHWNGRCKFHGGLSTGPTTDVGKAQARENGKLGGRGRTRKPKPMETPRKPQGVDAKTDMHILREVGRAHKPNPMKTPWKRLGCEQFQAPSVSNGKNVSSKPNSMECSQKLVFHGGITGMPERTGDLIKPDILLVGNGNGNGNGNVSVRVQCRDCANLSAGFSCMAPASGQVTPTMGALRICTSYVRL